MEAELRALPATASERDRRILAARVGSLHSDYLNLSLDGAYLALATVRAGGPAPKIDVLESEASRLTAHEANEKAGVNTQRGDDIPDDPTAVASGNQRTLFIEAARELERGYDVASAEQRNRQWVAGASVQRGDKQLWIVGAAHIPGLTLRFSSLGWRAQHMDVR